MDNKQPYFDPDLDRANDQYTPFAPQDSAQNGFAPPPTTAPANPYADKNGSYGDYDKQPPFDPYTHGMQQPSPYPPYVAQPQAPTDGKDAQDVRKRSVSALVFGIIAAVACETVFFSILGIIFGAIAKARAAKVLALPNPPARPCAVVGRILGTVSFIVGIVLTAILSFYFFIIFVALIMVLTA